MIQLRASLDMDIRTFGNTGLFLLILLVPSGSSEEILTCIPKQSSTIQDCHRFSVSCPQGSYIRFQTLQYHWSDCLNFFNCPRQGQCCSIKDINYYCHSEFSMIDLYHIYQRCSGQGSCNGTAVDVISGMDEPTECNVQDERIPANLVPLSLSMDYDCIEDSTIINLCEENSVLVNASNQGIHFMYRRGSQFPSTKQPTQCACSIAFQQPGSPKQPPTLAYQDIRLHREWDSEGNKSTCSSVDLSVSTSSKIEARHCTSSDPVTSFYLRDPEPVDADLVIKLDSLFGAGPQDEPEMIWLSVQAAAPVTVNCGSRFSPERKQKSNGDDDVNLNTVYIVVAVLCIAVAVGSVVIIIFIVLRKRKTRKSSLKPKRTVRTVGDFDVYDTIDELSRQGSKYSKTAEYTDAYSAVPIGDIIPWPVSEYNKVTEEDDYNRINLRKYEVKRDPEYSRLHSDADSGVGDTFGTLHINTGEDSEDDTGHDLNNSENKNTKEGKDSAHPESVDAKAAGERISGNLKRTHSCEKPNTETSVDDNTDSLYSKPVKSRMEHKHDDDMEVKEEIKFHQAKTGRRNELESEKNKTIANIKLDNIISDYEEVNPVSSTAYKGVNPVSSTAYEEVNPVSSNENGGSMTNNLSGGIALPKRKADSALSDSDSD